MLPPEPKLVRRRSSRASGSFKGLPVIPRHPVGRIGRRLRGVPLQFGEVVEGVGAAQFTGVDQAHEKVADLGAVKRAVKQCVLAVEHSAFEHLFAEIMPTSGLCRVDGLSKLPALFLMVADAA